MTCPFVALSRQRCSITLSLYVSNVSDRAESSDWPPAAVATAADARDRPRVPSTNSEPSKAVKPIRVDVMMSSESNGCGSKTMRIPSIQAFS